MSLFVPCMCSDASHAQQPLPSAHILCALASCAMLTNLCTVDVGLSMCEEGDGGLVIQNIVVCVWWLASYVDALALVDNVVALLGAAAPSLCLTPPKWWP